MGSAPPASSGRLLAGNPDVAVSQQFLDSNERDQEIRGQTDENGQRRQISSARTRAPDAEPEFPEGLRHGAHKNQLSPYLVARPWPWALSEVFRLMRSAACVVGPQIAACLVYPMKIQHRISTRIFM